MNSIIEKSDLINIGEKSFIEHSKLRGNINIGKLCWISGVRELNNISIPDDMCIQQISVKDNSFVFIIFGINDNIKDIYENENSTFCNIKWKEYCKKYNIKPCDIWNDLSEDQWNIWNAKLYPIFNLDNIDIVYLLIYIEFMVYI